MIRDALWITAKDLRIELRARDIVPTMTLFAVLVGVLASMSLYVSESLGRDVAPGIIWIAVAFAGTLGITRTWSRERDEGVLKAILLAGVSPASIYVGKLLSALLFVFATEIIVVPLVGLLLQVSLAPFAGSVALLVVLGTIGFVAAGTLFGAMGARGSARDLLVAVVLYPLVSPALLCGVIATREILHGVSLSNVSDWIRLILAFDAIFIAGGCWLLGPLLTD